MKCLFYEVCPDRKFRNISLLPILINTLPLVIDRFFGKSYYQRKNIGLLFILLYKKVEFR